MLKYALNVVSIATNDHKYEINLWVTKINIKSVLQNTFTQLKIIVIIVFHHKSFSTHIYHAENCYLLTNKKYRNFS